MNILAKSKKKLLLSMALFIICTLVFSPTIQVAATNNSIFSTHGPPSLAEWERIQTLPLKKAIPRDQWPEPPPAPLAEPFMAGCNEDTTSRSALDFDEGNYFLAGMYTSSYSYCGYYLDIYGGNIANDDPTNKWVRVTPHLATGDDYLAFILDDRGVSNQLNLWTYQNSTDTRNFQGTISKTTWYRFGIYINSDMSFAMVFAPVGQQLEFIDYGTFDGNSRTAMASPFLEQYINLGYSCAQHGASLFWNMWLYTPSGGPYAWNTSVSTAYYYETMPGGLDNPLQASYFYSNPSYYLSTWSP